jgi:hypothetical protein
MYVVAERNQCLGASCPWLDIGRVEDQYGALEVHGAANSRSRFLGRVLWRNWKEEGVI